MTILAIDTCFAACSAALLPEGRTTPIQRFEAMSRGHAEAIFPMIEAVLAEAECGYDALSRIAVTVGPGSFTGVRAGVAAARGLALAGGLPVTGASSLEVMARGVVRQLDEKQRASGFAVIHDARREEVYLQQFDARGEAVSEPLVVPIADAARELAPDIELIAGTGAEAVAEQARAGGRRFRPGLPDLLPEAADLAMITALNASVRRPPAPLYLRAPDAKPQTDKVIARAGS